MKTKVFIKLVFFTLFISFNLHAQVTVTTNGAPGFWDLSEPGKLVDGDLETDWSSQSQNMWIMFDYSTPATFKSYAITTTMDDQLNRSLKNWTLKGSNDAVSWAVLDTRANVVFPSPGSTLVFNFTNSIEYKYYRFDPVQNAGNTYTQLTEIAFSAIADTQAPTAPTGLSVSNITFYGFTLNWTASTDNVGVMGYKVYNNNTLIGTSEGTGTTLDIKGLNASTAYSNITVLAFDAIPNTSLPSNTISATTSALPAAKDLYVSESNVSGIEDGSIANPYKTIQQASNVATFGTVINIMAGVYREQVGMTSNGVTYQGYNNEKVDIDGTEKLSVWTLENGSTYKTTDMTWDLLPADGGNQLFVDKTMINLARWPDQTSTDLIMPTDAVADAVAYSGNSIILTCNAFNEPDGRWVGAQVWLNLSINGHDGQGWTGTVTATNADAHTITLDFREPPKTSGPWTVEKNSQFYLYNPLANAIAETGGVDALLSPGEWYKDGNTVYVKMPNLLAPDDGTGTSNIVEAKKRQFAFISSSAMQNRSSLTIRNLDIFACTITTDVLMNTRDNVVVEDANNILLENINAKYVSHFTDQRGNWQDQWSGRSGIVLSGRNNVIKNCNIQYSAGAGVCVIGYGNKLLNNIIKDCNYNCTNSGAVNTGGILMDSQISYNEIDNTTVMAINFKGLKNSTPSNRGVARINHNKISNSLKRSWDSGVIDMVGQDGQWIRIDHNEIFNTVPDGPIETARFGIYLDFGKTYSASNYPGRYIVDHNLIYNVYVPVLINHIMDVLVYNNTGVYGGDPTIGIVNGNQGTGKRDSIVNNILCGTWNKDSWGNLISAFKKTNIFDAKGTGENALDNLFVDPVNFNFNLKPTATTAINVGTDVTPYNDVLLGEVDLGAFEYGGMPWKAGKTEFLPPVLFPAGGFYNDSARVSFTSDKPGVTFRYTLNGKDPDLTSSLYSQPILLTDTTFVKVRAFLTNETYSDVASANFFVANSLKMRLHDAVTPVGELSQGLNYEYYTWLPDLALEKLPDLETWIPEVIDTAKNVGVNKRLQEDNFCMKFTGFIDVPVDGVYTFSTRSDDGSLMFIADSLVVNNDGLQSPTERSGMIGLKKGLHPFRVDFLEVGGGQTLTASFGCSSIPKQPILDNQLTHLPYVNRPAKVTFSPNGGVINGSVSVSILTLSTNATIYYTLDGSTPTSASTIYMEPITVTGNKEVKAIALASGNANGFVGSALFTTLTGVSESKDNSFLLYPNPSNNGKFKIQLPAEFEGKQTNLKIYNSIGKMVYHKTLNGISDYSFDGNNCSLSGIYLITIESASLKKQVKLIVN